MTRTHRHVLVAAIAATVVAAGGAGVAVAASQPFSGTAVNHVAVVTEDAPQTIMGNAWQTVASTDVESVAGDQIIARFSAESACFGGSGFCAARIVVDGLEAFPLAGPSGFDFAFDSTANNTSTVRSTEARSMERVISNSGMSSPVTVQVQVRMVGTAGGQVRQRLDDTTLSAWVIAP